MRALLDVSMLIALLDPMHVHSEIAHHWFEKHEQDGWASCSTTQNAYVRIVCHPGYESTLAVADAVALLRYLVARPSHEFWPGSTTILDRRYFDLSRLRSSRHVTDTYLLGLARANKGRFVTLDTRLSAAGVLDGQASLIRLA